MAIRPESQSRESVLLPYNVPRLKRLGSATELTKNRLMVGQMDGGANNSRTG